MPEGQDLRRADRFAWRERYTARARPRASRRDPDATSADADMAASTSDQRSMPLSTKAGRAGTVRALEARGGAHGPGQTAPRVRASRLLIAALGSDPLWVHGVGAVLSDDRLMLGLRFGLRGPESPPE